MQTAKITILALACLISLGACGLKGPLYLPGETPESAPAKGQTSDTDEDDKSENEENTRPLN